MPENDHISETPEQLKHRERLTIFVSPFTIKRIKTLEVIYQEKPGRIIDRLVQTLWNAKATKLQRCITGKSCQFNLQFPESDIL
jgi:cobalamin biosynthesis Co2+ chelatase CbiK